VPDRRFVVWPALALLLWAAAVHATGGFKLRILGFPFTSRDPLRPLGVGAVLLAAGYAVRGRREIDAELARVAVAVGRAAMPVAIVASLAVGVAGLHWGTFAASGVDAYGYVSQAALWTRGSLRVEQPFVSSVSWPGAAWAFAPVGYRPAAHGHAIVPSYPPGLPLLMALAERAGGDCGPYYVVPVLGALCVWCCFLLGRRAASPAVGACAAVLLACSPVFLFHLLVPMSDIPAAALWSAALYVALIAKGARVATFFRGPSHAPAAIPGSGAGASASAGACAALAFLVRPNLAPLAAVIGVFVAWPGGGDTNGRAAWKRAGWFAAPLIVAVAAIAAINWRLYGSPASSGYGDLGSFYAISHIAANVRRYAGWLVETQTPLIGWSAIGLLALWLPRSTILVPRAAALFLIFTLAVAASYLPYTVFEDWWFLRFLLPALPLLLVSMTASIFWMLGYLPAAARMCVFVALGTFLVGHELRFAIGAGLTRLQPNERRYVAVARFIEASMPRDAIFLTLQHSGSVRHYANRLTLRFDGVSTGLDDALASLERAGWRPFVLLEDWEEPQFKRQFGGSSELGRLAWRPYARLAEPGGVNIYDPKQAHNAVAHEIAVIPPPGQCDCRHW
jgi:hypothetical protein